MLFERGSTIFMKKTWVANISWTHAWIIRTTTKCARKASAHTNIPAKMSVYMTKAQICVFKVIPMY